MIEFAGERMTIREDGDKTVITFDDVGTGRRCGSCTLCCKLLPIRAFAKPANQRCQHQSAAKGCRIHPDRPMECRTWSCRWLSDPSTAGMPRPDRAHYVIDLTPDYITMQSEGGETRQVGVMQIWVDPAHRSAYRSPELRAWMLKMATQHNAAFVVRFNNKDDAILIFPPPLCADRQWHETTGQMEVREPTPHPALSVGMV